MRCKQEEEFQFSDANQPSDETFLFFNGMKKHLKFIDVLIAFFRSSSMHKKG